MKIKQPINFALLIAGLLILSFGDSFMQKEYALSIGFILMMFAVYKISVSWRSEKSDEEDK